MDSRKENNQPITASDTLIKTGLMSESKIEGNQKLVRNFTGEPTQQEIQDAVELQFERAEQRETPGFFSRFFSCFFGSGTGDIDDISYAEPLPQYTANRK